jgi:hypothetical protein
MHRIDHPIEQVQVAIMTGLMKKSTAVKLKQHQLYSNLMKVKE